MSQGYRSGGQNSRADTGSFFSRRRQISTPVGDGTFRTSAAGPGVDGADQQSKREREDEDRAGISQSGCSRSVLRRGGAVLRHLGLPSHRHRRRVHRLMGRSHAAVRRTKDAGDTPASINRAKANISVFTTTRCLVGGPLANLESASWEFVRPGCRAVAGKSAWWPCSLAWTAVRWRGIGSDRSPRRAGTAGVAWPG
jgi:hypothetical protein